MIRMLSRLGVLALIVVFATLSSQRETEAIYHIAVISEVMSGFDGDPDVQYVEIRMDAPGQHLVAGTVLSVFDEDGVPPLNEIMILPNDVPNSGTNLRWLMATQAFVDLTGLTPEFIMPPDILTPKGMVCWGAPETPLPPEDWNHNFPFFYTDCVSYGGYAGPPPATHPPASPLAPGDGEKALQRVFPLPITEKESPTEAYELYCVPPAASPGELSALHLNAPPDEQAFFACCPTPENNSGQVALMGADDDNDGLPNCHEGDVGTDPAVADTDQDGCIDGKEIGRDAMLGGGRDPNYFWDFMDVWTGAPPVRDQTVSIGDIGAVVARFGAFQSPPPSKSEALAEATTSPPPAPAYHASFDRGGADPMANPWNLFPPDGSVTVSDIGAAVTQFGHSCS